MSGNPVVWFEIYVQDMTRARQFYETVLGVELTRLSSPDSDSTEPQLEMYSFPMNMDGAGASGALARMEGVPSGGMGTLVYFGCEDCAMEESRVEPAGGKIFRPKMSIGQYGFISLVIDTEGNMIGLHSMK